MQQVGRYRLTRRLGQGGMAEVFEAVAEGESGFRRRVALKRVLPRLAGDPSIARMFLDEARTTSHLHHQGIVAVLDYGTADGAAFQVLEFVDGLDLDGLLRRAEARKLPLPVGLALHIVLQVAQALDHAHNAQDEQGQALGIVHRDVSPSNVLVAWSGHVKLSDFGIALAADRLERTEGAGVKGKLEYMSPEQAVRGNVDRRSDVFALGCMLHRLLTGKSPLAELSALTRIAAGEELSIDPRIDTQIREVILRATRHAQTQRYGSAAELGQALSSILPSYLPEAASLALQGWLATLRDDARAEKTRGALDGLLNVELVLSAPSDTTSERSFTIRTPLLSSPAMPVDAQVVATGEESEAAARLSRAPSTRVRSRTTHRWLPPILLLLAVLGGLTLYALRSEPTPPRLPGPTQAGKSPTLPGAANANAANADAVNAGAVNADAVNAHAVNEQTARKPRGLTRPDAGALPTPAVPTPEVRRAKTRSQSTPVPPLVTAPTATRHVELGTLVIGGAGALRAIIRIDGRPLGFAPKRLELPTGDHELILVRPDGTQLGPQRVRIESHHTQSAPAKWIVN